MTLMFHCLCTANDTRPPCTDMQFFSAIVLPLYSSMASALPALEPLLQHVRTNHELWLEHENCESKDNED